MKEPKFTKGPWIVSKTSGMEIFINHSHENSKRVPGYFAEVRRFTTDHEQVDANAHLIAAAPKLFDALKASPHELHPKINGEECLCGQCEFVKLRDSALANALGEYHAQK